MLNMTFDNAGLQKSDMAGLKPSALSCYSRLFTGAEEYTGWATLPDTYDRQELARLEAAAGDIRSKCTALVVIGIGGSYLGARAVADLLPSSGVKLYFAGQNMSAAYHEELMNTLDGQEVCLCVISKSGTTVEPSAAFAILKEYMAKRYGAAASSRIYAVTDASKGVLREEVEREGYTSFVVPDDIGGRYSVLTPVGLLPLAAAGVSPMELLEGAAAAKRNTSLMENAMDYAICRNLLYNNGKKIEVFEAYEPRFAYFAEWLKQLFGESEGKGGVGIFPASLSFSSDLHSMGQFLQQGTQCFFETVLDVQKPGADITVPLSGGSLAGKSMNALNRAALEGVIAAHTKTGVPVLRLAIDKNITAQTVGEVIYFFEVSCAVSAYMMGVNPFDQPGVESYKQEMRERM